MSNSPASGADDPLPPRSGAAPAFLSRLLVGNLLAAIILAGLVALIVWREYVSHQERATAAAQHTARLLHENVAALVDRGDRSLRTIALTARRLGRLDAERLESVRAEQQSLLPATIALRLVDAHGRLLAAQGRERIDEVADRAYFRTARDNPEAGLIVDGPLRAGNAWQMILARRVVAADGGFIGVAVAAVDVAEFQRLLDTAGRGAGAAAAIRSGDLRLIARAPAVETLESVVGSGLPEKHVDHFRREPLAGVFTGVSPVDGVERLVAYSKVGDLPLYALVGASRDDVLAEWRVRAGQVAAVAALAMLIMLLSSWLAYGAWRRQAAAHRSLRASEARFERMIEGVRDYAVFSLDAAGRVSSWNTGAERLTGYSAADIRGRPLAVLYPADDEGEAMVAAMLLAADAEGSVEGESRPVRRAGGHFLASHSVTAIGAGQGYIVILRDITEQRHAERAAQSAHRLLREAVDSIAIGFAIYDPDDRLVICNEAYRQLYQTSAPFIQPGIRFEDLLRLGVERGQYPEAKGCKEAWVRERLSRHLRADGVPFEQVLNDGRHLLMVEFRTPSGHIVGNRMDITELHLHRHRLEQLVETRTAELRSAMAQFRILIDQAPTAIAMFDIRLNHLAASRRWIQEFGGGREDLIGLGHYEVCGDLPEDWKAAHRAALAGITQRNAEDRWRRADGSEMWLSWVVYPWMDAGGQIGGIIIAAEDITARKANEDLRISYQRRLEQQVAERTAELLSANRELEGFVYAASHDLKAPLSRIGSFASLLDHTCRAQLTDGGRMYLDQIQLNARRLLTLVEDLLNHSLIEQHTLHLEPVELGATVRAVLEERAEEIRERRAQVSIDLPDAVLLASPVGIAQVLRNLLENALKYAAGARPPVIEIGGAVKDGRCHLWVRDNGIGFDMRYAERIFEIFRRLHTYEEFPGSGVGLALVKKAVERMGGRVWAESLAGCGATFHLELPLAGLAAVKAVA